MNGVLIVDKAPGLTSHDVVARARRALQTRKVGHCGTLDPLATGVLVLAVGTATRLVPYLTADDKGYEAELKLGIATHSLDADGDIVDERPVPESIDLAAIEAAALSFVGAFSQVPPSVSAIKVDGVALHKRVRRGEDVVAPARDVVVRHLRIDSYEPPLVRLSVQSEKGFYVRSLGRDLANSLGTVGHLTALRRLVSGAFTIDSAVPYALLESAAQGDEEARGQIKARMLDAFDACVGIMRLELGEEALVHARCGRPVPIDPSNAGLPPAGAETPIAVHDAERRLVAIARRNTETTLKVLRGFPTGGDT